MKPEPVTLTGRYARLEPLGPQHAAELLEAAQFDEIWTFLDEPTPYTLAHVEAFIDEARQDQAVGTRVPFATVDLTSGKVVGSTSFIDIRSKDRGLEIGWTWLTPAVWGTGVNTESKYLMLKHGFDDLDAIRVALKTDARNARSQRAIERLGATREGVWRNHRILTDGRYRDSVYYSVIASEWPSVRASMETRLHNG